MRASRLLLALGVLAAGVCAAWPFRHPAGAISLATGQPHVADVTFRQRDFTLEVSPASLASPAQGFAGPADGDEASLAAQLELPRPKPDLESLGPPPDLAPEFGPYVAPNPGAWRPARNRLALDAPAIRRHRLTDGDSLASLAQRYLGDPARADEIYQSNRDVLVSADVLPLGRIIRIPPAQSEHDLVPAQMAP